MYKPSWLTYLKLDSKHTTNLKVSHDNVGSYQSNVWDQGKIGICNNYEFLSDRIKISKMFFKIFDEEFVCQPTCVESIHFSVCFSTIIE